LLALAGGESGTISCSRVDRAPEKKYVLWLIFTKRKVGENTCMYRDKKGCILSSLLIVIV